MAQKDKEVTELLLKVKDYETNDDGGGMLERGQPILQSGRSTVIPARHSVR